MMIAHTPIEDGRVRMWHALMVESADPARPEQGVAVARAYQEASRNTLAQDLELWSAKRPAFQPLAIPKDRPIGKVRQWYSQFCLPLATTTEVQQKVDGRIVSLDRRASVSG